MVGDLGVTILIPGTRGDLAIEMFGSCGASAGDVADSAADSLLALLRCFCTCFSLFFFFCVSVVGDMITARGLRCLLRPLSSSREEDVRRRSEGGAAMEMFSENEDNVRDSCEM